MLTDHDWALTVLCEESRPDAAVTVSEWADEHRVPSSKASAEPGLWRTDRTPYLREIMDALSSYSTVETVVVMKGAQADRRGGRLRVEGSDGKIRPLRSATARPDREHQAYPYGMELSFRTEHRFDRALAQFYYFFYVVDTAPQPFPQHLS